MLIGIVQVGELPPQCTFWRFLTSLPVTVAQQLLQLQRRLRERVGIGACFVLQGLIMIWGSKAGKIRLRDKMIDSVLWRGDEQVLDVGCGHGLMLVGAAKAAYDRPCPRNRHLATGRPSEE